MGRPRREPDGRLNTSIRFDPALHERLLAEAAARQVSVNWMVTRLVAEGLDRLIPVEEMRLTTPPRST